MLIISLLLCTHKKASEWMKTNKSLSKAEAMLKYKALFDGKNGRRMMKGL